MTPPGPTRGNTATVVSVRPTRRQRPDAARFLPAGGIDALTRSKHHDDMGSTDPRGRPEEEPWRELFGLGSPSEILPRLLDGDRLELWPRCAEHVMHRCQLMDVERLYYRAVARIAHAGPTYRGRPELSVFLRERIEVSLNELMREDQEEERRGAPMAEGESARFRFLNEVLGMELPVTRGGVVRFNVLDEEVRQTFFALVVEMRRFNRYLAEGHGPPEKIRGHLRTAFEAIGASYDEWRARGGE